MICVYPAACTDFSGNGLGVVQPQSCTVTETLNGEWELTLVHPIDEYGKWTRLSEGNILRAPVPAAMTPRIRISVRARIRAAMCIRWIRIRPKPPCGAVRCAYAQAPAKDIPCSNSTPTEPSTGAFQDQRTVV